MNPLIPVFSYSIRLCLTLLFGLFATGVLSAQVVAPASNRTADDERKLPPTTTAAPAEEDVVELSPFVVSSAGDRGYQVQSSLGGSRVRANLKEIASPTTAFTSQFLEDAAITNVDDLMQYMLSTEYDYGEDSGGQNRLNSLNRSTRMRGLKGGSYSVNFFRSDVRFDTFSIDRVDQSRGPNSVLFGVGEPGGITNVSTKRAMLNGRKGYVSLQGKSHDGLRAEIDFNETILEGKLGFRIAAMDTQGDTWRNFEFNDETRYYATAKWRITPKTELNVDIEKGDISKQTKRTVIGYDAYTNWVAAGRNLGTAVNAAQQIQRIVAANRAWIVFDTGAGSIENWVTRFSSQLRQSAEGEPLPITDFGVLPKEAAFTGPGYDQNTSYVRSSAYLTHSITKDWSVELAALRLDRHNLIIDAQGAPQNYLKVDVNPLLPSGKPNPNAGKPYLESVSQFNDVDNRDDTVRLQTSYRLDLGKFGKHTIAAVHERSWGKVTQILAREAVTSANAPFKGQVDDARNSFYRRTYVDLAGPSEDVVMRDFWLQPINNLNGYTTAFLPFNQNSQLNQNEGSTSIGMIQSSFWKNRISTVVGGSYDQRRDFLGTQVRTPIENFTNGKITPIRSHVPLKSHANSISFSGVFQATDWLGLTYSQAENSALPNFTGRLRSPDGTDPYFRPPTPRGKSKDYGIKLDLFDHRLFLTALRFETSDVDDFDFSPTLTNQINPIWTTLETAGVPVPSGYTYEQIISSVGGPPTIRDTTTGATFAGKSKGYEVELTANPTPNWRIFANYSHETTTKTNIGPEMRAYVALWRPLWMQYASLPFTGGIGTVGDQVAVVDNALLANYILADDKEPLGQMKDKMTARTTYDFTEGSLKGYSVGGGVRYQSAPVVGYFSSQDTSGKRVNQVYRGAEQVFVDFNAAYRRKINLGGQSILWSLQLNINNVFNNDAFQRLRVSQANEVLLYRFNTPMEWILTSKFSF